MFPGPEHRDSFTRRVGAIWGLNETVLVRLVTGENGKSFEDAMKK